MNRLTLLVVLCFLFTLASSRRHGIPRGIKHGIPWDFKKLETKLNDVCSRLQQLEIDLDKCCRKEKPGTCPAVRDDGFGICLHNCDDDSDCPGGEKCCKNECGGKVCSCPLDIPQVRCFADPCKDAMCESDKSLTCRANYCGGCHQAWYNTANILTTCSKKCF